MIIVKDTKNQGFTIFLKNTFVEKPQEDQVDSPFFLGLIFEKIKDYLEVITLTHGNAII